MPEQDPRAGSEELQFDRVSTGSTVTSDPAKVAVVCAACGTSIDTEYYHINGDAFCSNCRDTVEAASQTPSGIAPFLRAGAFGLGAGIAGAAIYYAVIAIANLEVGIVAILIGYMVGYAVRKGARGYGGLRFQILAVTLTYASVGFAYMPLAFQGMAEARAKQAAPAAELQGAVVDTNVRTAAPPPRNVGLIAGLSSLLIFAMALPVLVIIGSFPGGLISAFIMFLGMSQAWRMTRAPVFQVFGPYRVGAGPNPEAS